MAGLVRTAEPDALILARVRTALAARPAGLVTDFDGTVSPIVWPPETAKPLPGVEAALRQLTERLDVVAVLSGRTVADLADRVRVPGALYVGLHGLEWSRAGRERAGAVPVALEPTAVEPASVAMAVVALRTALASTPGVRVEDKGMGVAVHYRDAAEPELARRRIVAACRRLVRSGGVALAMREGKRIIELAPRHGVDKGVALRASGARAGPTRTGLFRRRPDRPGRLPGPARVTREGGRDARHRRARPRRAARRTAGG